MAEATAPCNTRPRSPALHEAHEVIRALRLRNFGRGPPVEDSDSAMEEIPAPTDSASTGRTPQAGDVQALCRALRRWFCNREGWCPWKYPKPTTDNGALPSIGHAAARAALRYGLAQGWIQDETAILRRCAAAALLSAEFLTTLSFTVLWIFTTTVIQILPFPAHWK